MQTDRQTKCTDRGNPTSAAKHAYEASQPPGSMSIVAAELTIAFFCPFCAYTHFIPQQQRARGVGTASAASVNEINIGGV